MIYLDSGVIIRLVEGVPKVGNQAWGAPKKVPS